MHVIAQAQAFDQQDPTDANYVENVMWRQGKTEFVTLNIPGGSNNDSCFTEGGACAADAWNQHPFYDVRNFHRIVVHGSTFPLEWLKLTIDAKPGPLGQPTATSWGPFSRARETQPQLTP